MREQWEHAEKENITESKIGDASKLSGYSKRNPVFKWIEINLNKTALRGINQRLFEMRSYYYLGPTDYGYIIAILSSFFNEARN